jgi:hypothetical protein
MKKGYVHGTDANTKDAATVEVSQIDNALLFSYLIAADNN